MVAESVRAIIRAHARSGDGAASARQPHLGARAADQAPLQAVAHLCLGRFRSCGIGFIIGFIGAIMGIGGGFLLVPMLIYFLRVPTSVVIGTSMVLTLVTMAAATVLHAATNHLVDAVLALLLMVGGVIGAQFGARAGQKHGGRPAAPAARPAGGRGRAALRPRSGVDAGRCLLDPADGGGAMRPRAHSQSLVVAALCFAGGAGRGRAHRVLAGAPIRS